MINTIESQAKRRGNQHFDAVSSAICQFCKSAPSIPLLEVFPREGDPFKLVRYTFGGSFMTIRTLRKGVEISIHKRFTLDVPNDRYVDQELVAEVKAYLKKSLADVRWQIKQSRDK